MDTDYGKWLRWFFADRETRTASAFSSVPVAEALERLKEQEKPAALEEVFSRQHTNPEAMTALAAVYAKQQDAEAQSDARFPPRTGRVESRERYGRAHRSHA
jgi:hypothetical protein